jgi:hypothetical protein
LGNSTAPIRASDPVPDPRDWKLSEALALLCVLLNAGAVHAQSVILFEALRGLTISERGLKPYVWYQATTRGHVTNLGAIPDIAVTLRPDCKTIGANIQRVIEVKRVRRLSAQKIREEFAKAFDLNVRSYCLLTYYPIPMKIRTGASKFGLDVAELFIASHMTPADLVAHVCKKLEESRKAERFTSQLKTGYDD